MSEIKFWAQSDLSRLREAITGESRRSIASVAPPVDVKESYQDVLITTAPSLGLAESAPDSAQMAATLREAGVEVREALGDIGVTARVQTEQKQQLEDQGYLVYDNSPRALLPPLPQVADSSNGKWTLPDVDGARLVKADVLHQGGVTGKGQVVAVLDSGFDYPAMNDKIPYFNVITGSEKHSDGSGHGTHVASDVLKAAPDASLIAIQVMADDGTGRPSDIIKGLQMVEKLKLKGVDVDVVNMSLGGAPDGLPDSSDPINRMVDRLSKQGITVVAAAGNSGPGEHTIGSPADAPSSIAVGSGLNGTVLSDFSSRGPTDDNDVRPHVIAPGEFIPGWGVPYSEMYKTAQAVDGLRAMDGENLRKFIEKRPQLIEALDLPKDILQRPADEVESAVKPKLPPVGLNADGQVLAPGTSFAAPITAGVLASLEQVKDSSPAENRELLMRSADSMGNYTSQEQGAGFVNAEMALKTLQAT